MRAGDQVIPVEEILRDPTVLEEAERLARDTGLDVRDLAQVVNPFQHSPHFARSRRCTMVRLLGSQAGEKSGVDVYGDVYVRVYREIEFRHRIIPLSFDLHVLAGALEIIRQGTITPLERGCVAAGGRRSRNPAASQPWNALRLRGSPAHRLDPASYAATLAGKFAGKLGGGKCAKARTLLEAVFTFGFQPRKCPATYVGSAISTT